MAKPEQFSVRNPEDTFFWVESYIIGSSIVECLTEVVYQLVNIFGFDNHVVHVCLNRSTDLTLEACLNHALVCGSYVF